MEQRRRGNPEALAEYRRKVAAGEIVPKPPRPKAVPRDRWGRPRDSQKGKVYSAECCPPDPALAPRDRSSFPSFTYPDILVAQAWVDRLTRERWFQSRWGQVKIPVVGGRGDNASYRGRVMLSANGRMSAGTVLHEVAHWLASSGQVQSHGPEFAATLLVLVEGKFGKEAGRRLRESFVRHKVRYRSGMKAVPKPGTKPVVTTTQQKRQERIKVSRRRQVLAGSHIARDEAAEVVRGLVAEGAFGEVGSKRRAQALAVARVVGGQ